MRRFVRIVVVLALFASFAAITPGAVLAGGTFTGDDVSIFVADIEWLTAEGITRVAIRRPTTDSVPTAM